MRQGLVAINVFRLRAQTRETARYYSITQKRATIIQTAGVTAQIRETAQQFQKLKTE